MTLLTKPGLRMMVLGFKFVLTMYRSSDMCLKSYACKPKPPFSPPRSAETFALLISQHCNAQPQSVSNQAAACSSLDACRSSCGQCQSLCSYGCRYLLTPDILLQDGHVISAQVQAVCSQKG